jgi:Na+/H+ antiporter NhaD/arsenite permease-like protein
MPLPRWLDRMWLAVIALAFVFFALVVLPAFVTVWAGRVGWTVVVLFVASMLILGVMHGLARRRRDL